MIFDLDKGTGSERAGKIGANFACVDVGCLASVAKGSRLQEMSSASREFS